MARPGRLSGMQYLTGDLARIILRKLAVQDPASLLSITSANALFYREAKQIPEIWKEAWFARLPLDQTPPLSAHPEDDHDFSLLEMDPPRGPLARTFQIVGSAVAARWKGTSAHVARSKEKGSCTASLRSISQTTSLGRLSIAAARI